MDPTHDLKRSRWSGRTIRFIDVICFIVLIAVMVTVIYGFTLRAIWAHGYVIAVAIAVIGALGLMIGLAQQAIAARDAATWRSMAVWQIRAARDKVTRPGSFDETRANHEDDPYSQEYYEHLIDVVLESMRRASDEAPQP